jgi:hypothetical protein
MRARRLLSLIPVAALAAALAACGDGGVKKADYTAKADVACSTGNSTIAALAKPSNGPQVATAAGTASSTIDAQVVALRAMKTPGGKDKAQIEGVITSIADVGGPAKALQEAAGKTDDAAMAKAALDLQAKADAAAQQGQAYGLTQCGTGLKPAVVPLFDGAKSVVKADFVTKAEAACRDAGRKYAAIARPGTTAASRARYFDATLAVSNKLAADLRALPVAPGDEATVTAILDGMDALNAKAKELSAAANANNTRLVAGLVSEVQVAGTAVTAKVDAYGLKVCGSVSG